MKTEGRKLLNRNKWEQVTSNSTIFFISWASLLWYPNCEISPKMLLLLHPYQ